MLSLQLGIVFLLILLNGVFAMAEAAMIASRTTPLTAARTNSDWSAIGSILSCGGRADSI